MRYQEENYPLPMNENPWVSSKEASEILCVSEGTLQLWREFGYLKAGTHWRSAPDSKSTPWRPEVIYHSRWCKEEMEYWRSQDASVPKLAA